MRCSMSVATYSWWLSADTLVFPNDTQPHRWCNGKQAYLECCRTWVRALIWSNQRL